MHPHQDTGMLNFDPTGYGKHFTWLLEQYPTVNAGGFDAEGPRPTIEDFGPARELLSRRYQTAPRSEATAIRSEALAAQLDGGPSEGAVILAALSCKFDVTRIAGQPHAYLFIEPKL